MPKLISYVFRIITEQNDSCMLSPRPPAVAHSVLVFLFLQVRGWKVDDLELENEKEAWNEDLERQDAGSISGRCRDLDIHLRAPFQSRDTGAPFQSRDTGAPFLYLAKVERAIDEGLSPIFFHFPPSIMVFDCVLLSKPESLWWVFGGIKWTPGSF